MKKTIIILILSVFISVLAAACGEQEIALSEVTTEGDTIAGETDIESETTLAAGSGISEDAAALPEAVQIEDTGALYVYVCGEVVDPGVYELSTGARIYEAVALAGGLTENADASVINQAEPVTDGMMIRIPEIGSATASAAQALSEGQVMAADGSMLVDLNTADAASLMTLPGIGESKAAAIIAWRQENGRFTAIEDLMNVSGIGDSTYERLAPLITVTP